MSAETTPHPQGADPSQPTLSSPIDVFDSPSLLTLPPPGNRIRSSQSSSHPSRLGLVSFSTMSQTKSIGDSAVLLRGPTEEEEEVDELDEFDAHAPNELDFELCDQLEAESLLTATQSCEQLASTNKISSGSGSSRSPQKRTRTPSLLNSTQVIEIRDTSPKPRVQQPKRSKTQKSANDNAGSLKPFFEEDWVKDLLANSKGVRAFSPPEFAGPSLNAREPQQPPASQAARDLEGVPARAKSVSQPAHAQQGSTKSVVVAIRSNTGSGNSSSSSAIRIGNSVGNNSSSSDEDTLLANSYRVSLTALDHSSPRRVATTKVVEAVAELNLACQREAESLEVKLMERDLVIDGLRAQLRKRSSK
ncbi:hypothetical protein EX895_003117 [Sporisorium graminicola]|uniref:Uncharacterized protein n=1 Tax=Sporisorium graminicola TaxID=280036 RepID=A0A4U7KU00_9BASI|nr:hypothetical protein EX895_003117 [Sporisorium graminicola]TKY88021.1 hypothetical protein EX895_003117 [Sporisorium graminicola]